MKSRLRMISTTSAAAVPARTVVDPRRSHLGDEVAVQAEHRDQWCKGH
jgi:hypothetical protein